MIELADKRLGTESMTQRSQDHLQAMLKENHGGKEIDEGVRQLAETIHHEPGRIVAVIENRAKEVGIAALELTSLNLTLLQYVEYGRGYTNTHTILDFYEASHIVVVGDKDDIEETGLSKALKSYDQSPAPRSMFDDTKGFMMLLKYASPDVKTNLESGILHKNMYLAYGAAGALLKFIEVEMSTILMSGCLSIQFSNSENHMHIDSASTQALELVRPQKVGVAVSRKGSTTLFKLLDRTRTKAGSRLLRANILQPLRDVPTLNMRLDCLDELLAKHDLMSNVEQCLNQVSPDLDKICGCLSIKPAKTEGSMLRRIASMISSVILLRELLQVLPSIGNALLQAESKLLDTIRSTCENPAFGELLQTLDQVLEEDAQSSRNTFLNRTQQCFAVKGGVDSFLDIARQNFCRTTEQVHELADHYRKEHNLPNMRVQYTVKRGFYLVIGRMQSWGKNKRRIEEPEPNPGLTEAEEEMQSQEHHQATNASLRIPPGFLVLQKSGRCVHCTTNHLNALNSRIRDASNDCLVLTEQLLDGLTERIVESYLPLLNRLVDNVALLDMLLSFAQAAATSANEYVRPALTSTGPIAIVEGRHAILEQLDDHQYQPNDTYMALSSSFHVVTGPNMSGKSTYLKQVALVVIMAQIGSYVPATFASITPVDRLFTRIGTGDCLETNSSSFTVEMQETAYILNHATPQSLILIDELGRATSTTDGIGIAWAVSEHLIALGAYTLFATHFPQLAELSQSYPNCRSWHLDVETTRNKLEFSWKLKAGGRESVHYGLMLAEAVGFPSEVVTQASCIVESLDKGEEQRIHTYTSADYNEQVAVFGIVHKLLCVSQSHSQVRDEKALVRQLRQLKNEAAGLLASTSQLNLPGL